MHESAFQRHPSRKMSKITKTIIKQSIGNVYLHLLTMPTAKLLFGLYVCKFLLLEMSANASAHMIIDIL